jgi:hypothetical protein
VQLRAQLAARSRGSADPNELDVRLKQMDEYLTDARRRQLEIEARGLPGEEDATLTRGTQPQIRRRTIARIRTQHKKA